MSKGTKEVNEKPADKKPDEKKKDDSCGCGCVPPMKERKSK